MNRGAIELYIYIYIYTHTHIYTHKITHLSRVKSDEEGRIGGVVVAEKRKLRDGDKQIPYQYYVLLAFIDETNCDVVKQMISARCFQDKTGLPHSCEFTQFVGYKLSITFSFPIK